MQNIVEKINSLMHSIGREVKLPIFGKTCTPEHPVGACMVSTEGSCAAYYKYSSVVVSLSIDTRVICKTGDSRIKEIHSEHD